MTTTRLGVVTAATAVAMAAAAVSADARTISFSGYRWAVKESAQPVGPGPNLFSASPSSVFVDRAGRLHLRIARVNGRWSSAEVIGTRSLGYGTYRWTIDSPINDLDPNAVLGLFTWSNRSGMHNREIDIEFARWSDAASVANAQYTVQPYETVGNMRTFRFVSPGPSAHGLTWAPDHVTFASSGALPLWVYQGRDVPTPGGETPRMNLWLFRGRAPARGARVEVVIRSFQFTPLSRRRASLTPATGRGLAGTLTAGVSGLW